ncbi:MAG: Riboflavin transporter [Alphaproteobacteria bacterium MarineAlpha9_Bin4]|nr:hypothetical protein [Pelagibacterales bacterium]PPR27092.1 MAG: Riboflavin transporter [Alphaproteobacteria bacterium MarineAlpha9_Bin4]|tara:strand:+ start:589 stop:1479 length:891 start_codon:yes stop_codon:yes gene_type:complete
MSSSIKSGIWMLFASINFALLNTLVKYLSADFHLSQIIFFRSFFAVIFIFPWIIKSGIKSLKTNSIKLQSTRCILAVLAMYLWFYSISKIPLAEATAINFTAPIFGAIFAIFLLKEKIKYRRIIAILISLVGALIIIRPGLTHFNLFIFITLIASILMGMASVYIKKITLIDHPNAVVFYMPMVLAIVSFIPCIIFWKTPTITSFIFLTSTGLTAFLAHIGITKAFSSSDATFVLVFDYLRLPFTAVLAFILFKEVTDFWVWVGGLIIFLSSIYVAYRERKTSSQESTTLITAKRL